MPLKFDLTNLGRAPIRNAKIQLRLGAADSPGDPADVDIDLGCFADRENIHVSFWFSKTLGRLAVTWPTKAVLRDGEMIDFHSTEAIWYTRFVATIAALPAQDAAQAKVEPGVTEKPTFDQPGNGAP